MPDAPVAEPSTVYAETRRFLKDARKLDSSVITQLERFIDGLATGGRSRSIKIPVRLAGYTPTLHQGRLARGKWIVLFTTEDDPLFDERTVTLLRVVKHDDLGRAVDELVRSIYTSELMMDAHAEQDVSEP